VKKGLLVKLMSLLFLSTIFLYGFSHLGVMAYETFFVKSLTLSKHAALASVNLGGVNKEEAVKLIDKKITDWKENQNIILEFNGKSARMDPALFHFHTEESLDKLADNINTSLIVTMDENSFNSFLSDQFPDYASEDLNMDSLKEYILSLAGSLNKGETISIFDFISNNETAQVIFEAVSNELELTPALKNFIENYPSIPIEPNSHFSFKDFLETEGFVDESKGDLSPVASLLYQITLHSNFSIIERNISKELPSYATLGFEAKFNLVNNQDFVITNPNPAGYELKFVIQHNKIKAQLLGLPFPNTYNVRLSEKETFPPRLIKQFSPFVESGDVDIQQEGKDGVLIRVYRQKLNSSGEVLSEELINEDFYAPQHKIAVYPLKELEKSPSDIFDNVPSGENETETTDGGKEDETSLTENKDDEKSPASEGNDDSAEQDSSNTSDEKAKQKKNDFK
jgi:VanW like protein/G5 domain